MSQSERDRQSDGQSVSESVTQSVSQLVSSQLITQSSSKTISQSVRLSERQSVKHTGMQVDTGKLKTLLITHSQVENLIIAVQLVCLSQMVSFGFAD